jgi:hypothetical protein
MLEPPPPLASTQRNYERRSLKRSLPLIVATLIAFFPGGVFTQIWLANTRIYGALANDPNRPPMESVKYDPKFCTIALIVVLAAAWLTFAVDVFGSWRPRPRIGPWRGLMLIALMLLEWTWFSSL